MFVYNAAADDHVLRAAHQIPPSSEGLEVFAGQSEMHRSDLLICKQYLC